MKTMKKLRSFGPLLFIALLGCGPNEEEKARMAHEEQNVLRCEQMGGFPIRSIWDGRLTDCKFYTPPMVV